MKSWRENPDSEECQKAARENECAVWTAQMEHKAAQEEAASRPRATTADILNGPKRGKHTFTLPR
jgi:hypothetical protein